MVLEHLIFLCAVSGAGTLLVCLLFYFLFKLIKNPFDELGDEDIQEIDDMKSTLIDISGNLK